MNYTIYIKEKNLATNIKAAVHEYIKRLSPFCKATVCCAGKKKVAFASIGKNDFVIALCIEGKKYTTEQFAAIIRQAEEREYEAVSFLIGGSLGTSNELVRCADVKMSFSDMTFPHQLMRVMLLDQIRIICDK